MLGGLPTNHDVLFTTLTKVLMLTRHALCRHTVELGGRVLAWPGFGIFSCDEVVV